MKRTRGPWIAVLDEYGWDIKDATDETDWIASTACLGPGAEADARLMAAAPTLLKATRELLEFIEGDANDYGTVFEWEAVRDGAERKARAAIAQAEADVLPASRQEGGTSHAR